MKKILIPTDFSENAGDALSYALSFIGSSSAQLYLVNILTNTTVQGDMVVVSDDPMGLRFDEAKASMEILEKFGNSFLKEKGIDNCGFKTNVIYGSISEGLKSEAIRIEADLIIMGSQGEHHGVLDRLFGTVSTRMVINSPCPVLLIPRGYKFVPIDDVLFATNLKHSEPFELHKAIRLIKPNQVVLRCLHISKSKDQQHLDQVEEFSKYLIEHSKAMQTIFYEEVGDKVEDIIKEYAMTYEVEMVIMCKSKKAFKRFASKYG